MIQQKPKDTPNQKNVAQIAEAVRKGRAIITEGKTKIEAVRAMHPLIKDEPREIIWKTFEEFPRGIFLACFLLAFKTAFSLRFCTHPGGGGSPP